MKIIKKTDWQTLFVEEKNFLLSTGKAYFVQLNFKAQPGQYGIWISSKFADYGKVSPKTGKPYYAVAIHKEMTYKVCSFNQIINDKNEIDYKISKEYNELTGAQILELFFGNKK